LFHRAIGRLRRRLAPTAAPHRGGGSKGRTARKSNPTRAGQCSG
jgi:hypothetical protein